MDLKLYRASIEIEDAAGDGMIKQHDFIVMAPNSEAVPFLIFAWSDDQGAERRENLRKIQQLGDIEEISKEEADAVSYAHSHVVHPAKPPEEVDSIWELFLYYNEPMVLWHRYNGPFK